MKLRCIKKGNQALTLIETVVIIAVLAIFAVLLIPANHGHAKTIAMKISCLNNIKQITLAVKIWSGDSSPRFPMQVAVEHGGTLGLNTNGDNAWLNYLVMSNELSTPKILICPADIDRLPAATNFSAELKNKISYFIGLDASDEFPERFLCGDDNFMIENTPVKPGLLEVQTNASLAWSSARHKFIGNIALVDGGAYSLTSSNLLNYLHRTNNATNNLAIP